VVPNTLEHLLSMLFPNEASPNQGEAISSKAWSPTRIDIFSSAISIEARAARRVRLSVQDTALSRLKDGFDSRTRCQPKSPKAVNHFSGKPSSF
jgi:hypothetical protein